MGDRAQWARDGCRVPLVVLAALALTVAATLLLGVRTSHASQVSQVLPPASDPFYVAPANLASAPPGTILRSRQVSVYLGAGVEANGNSLSLATIPLTGRRFTAYQLLYRTSSATGQPVANVTTVIVPDGAAPTGGRKLVSLQDAEDSLDSECAPSFQLQVGEQASGSHDNSGLELELSTMVGWLARGYDLVIPDAEGPDSQWIVKGIAAHAVLDSIRAVEHFNPAESGGPRTPVGMVGYSGGGFESAAANELQPAYAPELNIVGVAAGGVPSANVENLDWLNNSIVVGYAIGAAVGIDRAYPQLGLSSLLNSAGQAVAEQVSKGCDTPGNTDPYANFDSWMKVPNFLELPQVKRVITENELGHAVPTAPSFYYNVIHDEAIWVKPLDELIGYYCARGAWIDYFRDPGGQEHETGLANFASLANAYLMTRFAGDRVPDTCGRPGNAAAGTGLIPAPTINYGWSPATIASR